MSTPNEKMAKYWNEQAGPRWVALQDRLDVAIREIGDAAIEAASPAPGESVVDVGCGCGTTVLEIAHRVGPAGRVLGLDVSEPMLARARARIQERGFAHVTFAHGDAQVRPFDGSFDLVFSRFGVMFFEDPTAAFANLLRAARPGGRLAFVCWREREKNPWLWTAVQAAGEHVELPEVPDDPHAPGPFGLHDAERLAGILADAGWEAASLRDLDVVLRPGGGGTLEEVVDFSLQMGPLPDLIRDLGEEDLARVRESVRAALAPHEGPEGVTMPGAARIVTARRPD